MGAGSRGGVGGIANRPVAIALVAALLALVAWFGPARLEGDHQTARWLHNGDTPVYRTYARKILQGKLPYRDFAVEYPPLAVPVFVAPYELMSGHGQKAYRRAFVGVFGVLSAALAACTVLAAHALGRRVREQALAGALVAAAPAVVAGSIELARYDLWPTLLAALACLALARRRPAWAAALAGAGAAAKLWPVLLAVPAICAAARWSGRRGAVRAAVAFGLAAGIPFAVGFAMSPAGMLRSLHYQTGRPIEVESLGAAGLVTLHKLGLVSGGYRTLHSFGSFNLTGGSADAIATATGALAIATAAALLVVGARRIAAAADDLVASVAIRHGFAAIAVAVALGKVVSPQYMVWLLPFPFLVDGARRRMLAAAAVLAALLLTRADALSFDQYWRHFPPWPTVAVLLRDLLVLALALLMVAPGRNRRRIAAAGLAPASA